MDFLARYLPDRRADELRVVRQLVPQLRACQRPVWFLTLVAKQDLWKDEQEAVEAFYRAGDYGAEITGLLGSKDPAKFRHEWAFASLVITTFATGAGDELKKNLAGYDHRAQVESVRRLIELVHGLTEWGAGS